MRKTRLTVWDPPEEVVRRLKIVAAQRMTTLRALVIAALERAVVHEEQLQRRAERAKGMS